MNVGNGRGQSATHYEGKGVVIILVVLFSSLSFTLGFFVGKRSDGKTSDYTLSPAVESVAQNGGLRNVSVLEMQSTGSKASLGIETPGSESKREHDQAIPEDALGRPSRLSEEGREDPSNTLRQTAEERPSERSLAGKKPPLAIARENTPQDGALYFVQVGALKNYAEARRLKERYARKGYRTSITVARLKNKDKVYKVRAGEFHDRKDAELFALKLQKNEGVHAFITLNTD